MKIILNRTELEEALVKSLPKLGSIRLSEDFNELVLEVIPHDQEEAVDEELEALKKEAQELGISLRGRQTVEGLKAKIKQHNAEVSMTEEEDVPWSEEKPKEEEKPKSIFQRR